MVDYEQRGRVAVLTINRPEARNAVNKGNYVAPQDLTVAAYLERSPEARREADRLSAAVAAMAAASTDDVPVPSGLWDRIRDAMHDDADTELPAAALKSLEVLAAATGLLFPTDRLREESRDFLARVDEQVGGNEELGVLVRTLEERHDTYMAGNPVRSPLTDDEGEVPTADELAAELEKFLAIRRHPDDEV